MFDDIKVPTAYLKGILDKKTEKLFNNDIVYQTKSLENACFSYKVYRRQLYKHEGDEWVKVMFTGVIDFYTSVKDEKETNHWFDFKFLFKNGKLDSKEFVSTYILETKKERIEKESMYQIEQQYFDDYREKSLVKIWDKLARVFSRLSSYAQLKAKIPYKVIEKAYKASGRLKKHPNALNQYKK